MNKSDARKIAEDVTNEQLQTMLNNAKEHIKDWTVVSTCNKGMTKGVAWNVLAKNFDINKEYHNIVKYNMVREFGEYIEDSLKPQKKPKRPTITPYHQDPEF